jgi:hypothetical protein
VRLATRALVTVSEDPTRIPISDNVLVFRLLLLLVLHAAALDCAKVATALETNGGDKALDFGSLGVGLRVLIFLALHFATNDVLADIVLLREVEEPPDLGRSLRAKPLREDSVGEAGNLLLTLLHDDEREYRNVRADNAASNRLAFALAGATRAIARITIGEEEADTVGKENTLFHWEALLVISTSDADNVSLPLIADAVGGDLLGDFLVVEDTADDLGQDLRIRHV